MPGGNKRSEVDVTWLKFGNQYLANAGVVVSTIACHCYCPSSYPVRAKFQLCSLSNYSYAAKFQWLSHQNA